MADDAIDSFSSVYRYISFFRFYKQSSWKGEPAMTATVNPRKTCELERWSLPW